MSPVTFLKVSVLLTHVRIDEMTSTEYFVCRGCFMDGYDGTVVDGLHTVLVRHDDRAV